MIKITNILIPFRGFIALTVWPFVFVRKDMEDKYDRIADNHEAIHGEQQKEMLAVGGILAGILGMVTMSWWCLALAPAYILWYLMEWMLRAVFGGRHPYKNISFEREAYDNERDMLYLDYRTPFRWMKYL